MQYGMGRKLSQARAGAAVLAGLWIALLGAGPAQGAIPIAQTDIPLVIDEPGQYVVVEDLSSPGDQPAITIAADHVQLDLHGFALSGPADGTDDCSGGEASVGIA